MVRRHNVTGSSSGQEEIEMGKDKIQTLNRHVSFEMQLSGSELAENDKTFY